MKLISDWFQRYFADPQTVLLVLLLVIITAVILLMGQMLAPVLAGIVLAYLLEGLVQFLQVLRLPRLLAVWLVFILFCAFVLFLLLVPLPLLSRQLIQLAQQFPSMVQKGYALLESLPSEYPDIFTQAQVLQLTTTLNDEITKLSQNILGWSLASVTSAIAVVVYLILVPLLVFFFLKDKDRILTWVRGFLPADYTLIQQIWQDVDAQLGNYIRGKFWQILIVWGASFTVFALMQLQFAMLLGLIVGLSVIVPYIGAIVAALPVAIVAFFQWGWNSDFFWVLAAYAIIQFIDGNLLVFLLFSEVVDLHPLAIIVAVLVFGGLWGFWGVFFAIPLATVVQAVLKAWPRRDEKADLEKDMIKPSSIPADWVVKSSKKGGGEQYINPNNPHDRVRIMPGNSNNPNPAQQGPYVKRIKDGSSLDKNGNPVEPDSPEAHIPLDEFEFKP